MQKRNSIEGVLSFLPSSHSKKLVKLTSEITNSIHEIRLKAEKPMALICKNKAFFMSLDGNLQEGITPNQTLTTSNRELFEIFQRLCGFSVYNIQNELMQGYITVSFGIRVGIAGTAVIQNGSICNVKDISSITIRIAREFIGAGDELARIIREASGGVLLCGAPCSGKTTVIRDICRQLSADYTNRITIVDTRGEIAAVANGLPQNDIGLCDILDGYPRNIGITQAIRCLSPDIIVCDEIGTNEDCEAILQGVNSGVRMIATIHCENLQQIAKREYAKEIIKSRAFEKICFLYGRENPGKIKEIKELSECLNFLEQCC